MPVANLAIIRRRLLGWYQTHKRDFPWRRTSDPYAIWVAETMLQQTQVSTVAPYYQRFIKAFPTVSALDRASLDRVLGLWSGLGYYRRAENMKKSARILVKRYRGRLPDDYDKLRALPGIGEYTAGALLSIAFGKPYPAIDGNARRVLSRIFRSRAERKLREVAWHLTPKSNPGQFTQSLMELGRTLCAPMNPRCIECPVVQFCGTGKNGHSREIRAVNKKTATRDVIWPMAIVRRDGRVLLRRRPTSGILAGLWEFPGGEIGSTKLIRTALWKHLPGLETDSARARRLGEIAHGITTLRIRAPVFLIDMAPAEELTLGGVHWRWVAPAMLDRYPVSSITRKALKLLADDEIGHS